MRMIVALSRASALYARAQAHVLQQRVDASLAQWSRSDRDSDEVVRAVVGDLSGVDEMHEGVLLRGRGEVD